MLLNFGSHILSFCYGGHCIDIYFTFPSLSFQVCVCVCVSVQALEINIYAVGLDTKENKKMMNIGFRMTTSLDTEMQGDEMQERDSTIKVIFIYFYFF